MSIDGKKMIGLLLAMSAWPASGQYYKQTNLVADTSGVAVLTDPLLKNPWGVAASGTSPFWVANAGSNTATLYAIDPVTGAVSKAPLTVTLPASPSGQIFNGTGDFVISQGGGSGPARFLFSGLNGTIMGWNPDVPPPSTSTVGVTAATGTPAPLAYTGLAAAQRTTGMFLYAANNAAGRIDVFDKNFVQVALPGTFTDPGLPAGDRPFNVVNIQGSLFVTYSGPAGVVNIFDTDGNFVKRFATGGTLLNPWGVALAPDDFGKFSNAVLVGNFNFGDPAVGAGAISAFDPGTGNFLGVLKGTDLMPLSLDGLWTLAFGNGKSGGNEKVLYFSAGVEKEQHGLFGSLAACHAPAIADVAATPNALWPPNHKMVPVTVGYKVTDDCDPAPVCSLTVTSNEGAGGGSGNTSPDWVVVDAHHVELRAERAGTGDGRVYTIKVGCTDKFGFESSATTAVMVAHDQGK